jgi:TRAP-type mannitol/chloroaromatic compound transport system substrate-binding protein
MKRKIFLSLAALLLFYGMTVAVGDAQTAKTQPVYKFRLQSILSPGFTEWDKLLPRFVDRVKTMSQGRIEISLFPAGALVPPLEAFKAVGRGTIDLAHNTPAYWMGVDPVAYISWFGPPEFRMVDQYEYLWWELGLLDLMRKKMVKHNVYMVAPIWSDEWGRVASRKPINSLKDFKGLKVRTWGAFGEILKKQGASIVSMPGQELYTAFSTGTIDAANWGSPALNNSIKLQEVAKYYVGPPLIWNDVESIDMNLDKWKTLPPDLQQVLISATREFAIERTSFSIYESAKIAKEWVEKYGVKFQWLPESDMAYIKEEASKLLAEHAKKDEMTAEAFKIIMNAQKDYQNMRWMVPH